MRAFYWTDDRATVAYDIWVIAILAFVWLTPPDWLGDPMAEGGARDCSSGLILAAANTDWLLTVPAPGPKQCRHRAS